jgi:raffinose/stachyose/melibiose transport system permease protein
MSTRRKSLYGGKWTVALMLGPALLLMALFVLYPAVDALIVAMSSWSGFAPHARFIGLNNFRELLFRDPRFWLSFKHTCYYVVFGGLGHFSFALLFAWGLSHPRLAGKKIYQTMLFFPAFISVSGVAILWARLYDPKDGLLNRLLGAFQHCGIVWLAPENAMNSILIASIWAGVGGQMILLLAGMRRIPASFPEAARIDGASEAQILWHVTLPMLKDVAYIAVILWLIGAMQVFGLVQALAGPTVPLDMETVATYQYSISFNNRTNVFMMGRGTAMALLLVATIVILAGIARLLFGRRELEY